MELTGTTTVMKTNELPSFKFYWNGTIITTPGGVAYVSGKSEIIKVRSMINYGHLEMLIRRVIRLNDGDEIVKIYLRMPRFDERGQFVKYDAFPIETDAHMPIMFRNASSTSQMRLLEFYIVYNPLAQVCVDVRDTNLGDLDNCDDSGEEEVENHFCGAVNDDDNDMFGEWDDSFGEICNFMSNMTATNPGTVWHATGSPIVRSKEDDPEIRMFKRMFWTYEPLVAGFRYCKPVVYIDGTHLYGKYEMTLLIASAIDGNNHIMPIAFALVRSETGPSWKYFMRMLKKYVLRQRKVCIISDQSAGIMTTMDGPDWTSYTHKICIQHLMSNFHTSFKKKHLKILVEKAGRAYQVKKRERYMRLMQAASPQGYAYLNALDPGNWSMSGDTTGSRHGVMTINYAESINAMLKNIHRLPVTAMLEAIFNKLGSMFTRHWTSYKEYLACDYEWTPLCAHIMKHGEEKSKTHKAALYNPDQKIYDVKTWRDFDRKKGGHRQQVYLLDGTCTCGKFQQWKIPCSHAIAACTQYGENPRQYIAWFYRCEYAILAWSAASFQPLRDRDHWIDSTEIPFVPNSKWMRKKGGAVESKQRNEMDHI
ncbi:uncharacterized protein LOC126686978 isoform X1 [Mercurialis annua]|uniref:uncharacterized protein LOC126686978 isoform X1 n=1 Tax=Mercurialis annua TaxID=3986 RepID=UPI00215FA0F5|nr:uncharacterized protein LOC126686978 isoform X1 [Mercurialis annua]